MFTIPVEVTRTLFRQIVSGIKHLHFVGIAHRDIKLDNIAIDTNFLPILIDYGFAVNLCRPGSNISGYQKGTYGYLAPELIQYTEDYNPFKADIWALGITLFLLLHGGDCAFGWDQNREVPKDAIEEPSGDRNPIYDSKME